MTSNGACATRFGDGAEGAPEPHGLAEGARRRLRNRRRRLTTVGAVVAVVAVALPVGLLASDDDPSRRSERDPVDSALEPARVTCGHPMLGPYTLVPGPRGLMRIGPAPSWPVLAMDGGVSAHVDDSEVRAALADLLGDSSVKADQFPQAIREKGANEAPYIVLAADDDVYTLGTGTWATAGPGEDGDTVTLERQDGKLRVTGWNTACHLWAVIPEGRLAMKLKAPEGGVDGSSTDPVVRSSRWGARAAATPCRRSASLGSLRTTIACS